ncbi:MAG TPA: protoporphyrinogen oxidase [Chlamydiales bacterium]|nr:protoporphyrinogen oxidase [Chlamydiales bacterium]
MKIIILGGGITGLSAAHALSRKYPDAQITLLEKENRLGGWIRTSHEGGFLFEQGPRTFPFNRSPHLLSLIQDLKLEIITAAPQKRYLYIDGRLRSIASLLPSLLPYLIREPFIAPATSEDESIYDFAARRFSPKIAETFFDPLTLGIYAGDIRKLSIRSCFPFLYNWERTKGSIIRALLFSKKGPKTQKGLFTVAGGMEALIQALQKQLPVDFVLNCRVETISEHEVQAGGKTWQADLIVSALPLQCPARSLWVVNLAYEGDVLSKKGYGYLVPSNQNEAVLGVIFDSCIFPQQNSRNEMRLTAMIRAEETAPIQTAIQTLARHLGIATQPTYTSAFFAQNAIPQFEVGCNYSEGLSVDACVERGFKMASEEMKESVKNHREHREHREKIP